MSKDERDSYGPFAETIRDGGTAKSRTRKSYPEHALRLIIGIM
jgi:hypothetical protein